ncbi:hypothetical protein AVEN_71346-1 [Araneus ventricosus]|uniref:Uncharacterized protein n=1 Tax=Araneus ventricosus TaxID=182803 RepID=A0A4Y2BKC8_ARAVE|nr:hypothetical protein AVEN_71346-1 [Araneus ventricosus]
MHSFGCLLTCYSALRNVRTPKYNHNSFPFKYLVTRKTGSTSTAAKSHLNDSRCNCPSTEAGVLIDYHQVTARPLPKEGLLQRDSRILVAESEDLEFETRFHRRFAVYVSREHWLSWPNVLPLMLCGSLEIGFRNDKMS